MADQVKNPLERLTDLAPEARARVESALKANIEAELVKSQAEAGGAAAKEFSRGIFFSRSRGDVAQLDDRSLLTDVKTMDEATFSKFANRLAALKNLKDTGGGK